MKRLAVVAVAVAAAAVTYEILAVPPAGPRSLRAFDADRLAELETDMWRAYYKKEKVKLFLLLVTTLREQYRLPRGKALTVAYHWAKAAAYFGDARGGYERALPDLTRGYETVRAWMRASWDAGEVARAELAWWVARRDPKASAPDNVGRLIGELYAKIYGVPVEKVTRAGVLRAQAGHIRDEGGAHADWKTVDELLHESYRSLRAVL